MPSGRRKNEYIVCELTKLRRLVKALPAAECRRLLPLCQEIASWARRQHRLVQAAQEAVNQYQLDIKYLRFDLEATRRERDALRQERESER